MSAAAEYLSALGIAVAGEFGSEVTFTRHDRRLVWSTSFGSSFVSFAGSNKWSPSISIDFYFGNRYEEATRVEKLIGRPKRLERAGHILQYSLNARNMKGLDFNSDYTFKVDIRKPPVDIVTSIAKSIRQIALPFWNRYPTMLSARDALLSSGEWCFCAGGHAWFDLLYLDAALDELDHYESWLTQLDSFYVPYATAELEKVKQLRRAPK